MLKKKTESEIIEILDTDYIENENMESIEVVNTLEEMENRIELLEKDMRYSVDKIRLIEEFLLNNTRGHYEKAMKRQSD